MLKCDQPGKSGRAIKSSSQRASNKITTGAGQINYEDDDYDDDDDNDDDEYDDFDDFNLFFITKDLKHNQHQGGQ